MAMHVLTQAAVCIIVADARPGGARKLKEPSSSSRGLAQHGCRTALAGSTEDLIAMRTR